MGNGNKVEMLVAICALLTSAMAVFMAWDQGRVMRAQQHGAVYPVLQVDGYGRTTREHASIGIDVRNSGVGPALIESVKLTVEGDEGDGMDTFMQSMPAGYELSWAGLTGRALAPGETVTPIDMRWLKESFDLSRMASISQDSQRWSLEICYCSVFGRCWKTQRIGRSRAIPVKQCERGEVDIFEQLATLNAVPSQPDTSGNEINP